MHCRTDARVDDDAEVANDRATLVDRLETFDGDILSASQFDEVLLAIDNRERAVGVPLTDVARHEPAFVIQVLLGRIVALYEDVSDLNSKDEGEMRTLK